MRVVEHDAAVKEVWRTGVLTTVLVSAVNGTRALCIFEQTVAVTCGHQYISIPLRKFSPLSKAEQKSGLMVSGRR